MTSIEERLAKLESRQLEVRSRLEQLETKVVAMDVIVDGVADCLADIDQCVNGEPTGDGSDRVGLEDGSGLPSRDPVASESLARSTSMPFGGFVD